MRAFQEMKVYMIWPLARMHLFMPFRKLVPIKRPSELSNLVDA